MSSKDIAVSVRGLSKSYSIAHNAAKHTTLGEALMHRFRRPMERTERETFWALKDVSFDIKKGDVVGIIGRNGAGKSTLLKILSRITEPTTGAIDLYGRVGSLLEVGTGFHPELTGRENIYLNGAILGMKRSEITRQFDAIVDFAEVEKFLDTPVKRYSSGMYVRLAFAVAAHLNPEILIVDEVLAVGDSEFQKKCLGKMSEVGKKGKTVIFVSHNISALSALCSQGLFLRNGCLVRTEGLSNCISLYLNQLEASALSAWHGHLGNEEVAIHSFEIFQDDSDVNVFFTHKPTYVTFNYELHKDIYGLIIAIKILSGKGVALAYVRADYSAAKDVYALKGKHCRTLTIPANTFSDGYFTFNFDIGIHNLVTLVDQSLTVHFLNNEGVGLDYPAPDHFREILWPKWSFR